MTKTMQTETALSEKVAENLPPAIMEKVLVGGDLSKLTSDERVSFYAAVCQSLGLNPLTQPFEYINLNGKLRLYARRDACDQLRRLNGISVRIVNQAVNGNTMTVHVRAIDRQGREDEDFGVLILPSGGENRTNAIMKCVTKAKRRVTLSICGLGFLSEEEVDDVAPQEYEDALFNEPLSLPGDEQEAHELTEDEKKEILRAEAEEATQGELI